MRSSWLVFVLSCLLIYCEALPAYNLQDYPIRNAQYTYGMQPRPFGSAIGDWINNSEWFPIEFNVIDFITGINNGVSGIFSNGFFGGNGLIQRIPVIHKWSYHDEPRPLKYYLLLPNQPNVKAVNTPKSDAFNPFYGDSSYFPHYP